MGELVFIGMGLGGEMDLSLRALSVIRKAHKVFLERYTSLLPELDISSLEKIIGKRVITLKREDLEENGEAILREAERGMTVLLVPGDPFIATTHITLRIEALKRGLRTKVIHSASIFSAACSAVGLQSYKFGKSVTIVYPNYIFGYFPETPYEVLHDNLKRGLHTLFLLDLRVEEGKFMSVNQALKILMELENRKGYGIVNDNTLIVGLARVGCESEKIKGECLKEVLAEDFGPPPHSLIIPGELHPMEVEALIHIAKVSRETIERWNHALRKLRC